MFSTLHQAVRIMGTITLRNQTGHTVEFVVHQGETLLVRRSPVGPTSAKTVATPAIYSTVANAPHDAFRIQVLVNGMSMVSATTQDPDATVSMQADVRDPKKFVLSVA
jgi:hypothetical protein